MLNKEMALVTDLFVLDLTDILETGATLQPVVILFQSGFTSYT